MNTVNGKTFPLAPGQSGEENCAALQTALKEGGLIEIRDAGTYDLCRALYIGDDTTLSFAPGVLLNRTGEQGGYVLLNTGAFNGIWNKNIRVLGMTLATNGFGPQLLSNTQVTGLIGQVSFHFVENLTIDAFTCLDVPSETYCIQICTFRNIRVCNTHIEGMKDGVHLGAGTDFEIKDCTFRTFDDPIALNAKDYGTCQPEMNWLNNGLIENCVELEQPKTTGYFCRLTGGSWLDWQKGMEVQHSDMAVSQGNIYTVILKPDGEKRISKERPSHERGQKTYPDGVTWSFLQQGSLYSCGCRNIRFRNIRMDKTRQVGFAMTYGRDAWERSCYPGSKPEEYGEIVIEHAENTKAMEYFLWTITPCKRLRFVACTMRGAGVHLAVLDEVAPYYPPTEVIFENCTFDAPGQQVILSNDPRREVNVRFTGTTLTGGIQPCIEGNPHILSADFYPFQSLTT